MMQTKKYARLILAGGMTLMLAGALGGCAAHAEMEDKLNAAATRTEAAADRATAAAAEAEKAARSAEAAADRAERAFAHNIKK